MRNSLIGLNHVWLFSPLGPEVTPSPSLFVLTPQTKKLSFPPQKKRKNKPPGDPPL